MSVSICAYRDWALEIYDSVKDVINCKLITSKDQFKEVSDSFKDDDTIFFIGWSWIIDDNIIQRCNCICLHPSPLPLYRGGSPFQHQIINGESTSAVTYFKMTSEVDAGEILYQQEMSLKGGLQDIFNRVIPLGVAGLFYILNNNIEGQLQDESKATYFKRRKPSESEINLDDFKSLTAEELYNKIRSLQDPYPNAYITCKDGKRIFITEAYYEE